MDIDSTTPWSEAEYMSYLLSERRLYAWCLAHYGGLAKDEAESLANSFYEYESPDDPYRELVFHDEAWHWAMRKILGDGYWMKTPERASPSAEYRAEAMRIEGQPK